MKPIILVPYDFEACAEAALAWATDLQRSTGGPPLHIVHAVNPFPGAPEVVPVPPTEDEVDELVAKLSAATQKVKAEAIPHVMVRASAAGNVILDAAQELRVDLIVMGTHGRTGLRRILLGSVAEHVLRHATCPVVTVRSPR